MIEYREIKRNEIKKVARIVAETFGEYPMYTLTFRDKFKTKEKFIKYIIKLNKVHILANLRKHKCFVGIMNKEIVSVAILQNPKIKRVSLFDYIISCGITLLFPVGLKRLVNFFDISNIAHKDCEKYYKNAWYIELLAVSKEHKGEGIGSKMISECLIPYIKINKGDELTLITNTKQNCIFYKKNGFKIFAENDLNWKNNFIENYSLYKTL